MPTTNDEFTKDAITLAKQVESKARRLRSKLTEHGLDVGLAEIKRLARSAQDLTDTTTDLESVLVVTRKAAERARASKPKPKPKPSK